MLEIFNHVKMEKYLKKRRCILKWQNQIHRDRETDERGHFEYFYGCQSPFSHHHMSRFEVDGIQYNCMEQYMMHKKAGNKCTRVLG